MARFDVIESKVWQRDDGRTASIYGAVPWTSPSEERRWKMITRGYTVRDNSRGTVGIGRPPWPTRDEAQTWVDEEEARLASITSRGDQRKSPAQLQREIDEALARKPAGLKKRGPTRGKQAHATKLDRAAELIEGYDPWTSSYSNEDSDRAVGLANRLTDIDRAEGRPAPPVGFSAERYAQAQQVVEDMNRYGAKQQAIARQSGRSAKQLDPGEWWDSLSRDDRQTAAARALAGGPNEAAVLWLPGRTWKAIRPDTVREALWKGLAKVYLARRSGRLSV